MAVFALLAVLVPAAPAYAPPCELKPRLAEFQANQTLPYQILASGKNTLLRLHLTAPSCASTDSSIQVTGGSVTVATTPTVTVQMTPDLVPTAPVAPCCAALPDGAGDARFALPGSLLRVGGTIAAPVVVPFSVRLTYTSKTAPTATPAPGEVTYTAAADGKALQAAFVAAQAMKTLVVPLGRSDQSYETWWPLAAQADLLNGWGQASRMLPVAAGVCSPIQTLAQDLTNPCGVQYSIDGAVLDVRGSGAITGRSGDRICVGQASFETIKGSLAQRLQQYNQANPQRAAGAVMGVMASAKFDANCSTVGMAAVGSFESVALVEGGDDARTAAITVQERAHNFGLRGITSDDDANPRHSPSVEVDGGFPNAQRTHNLISLGYEPNDRTALRFFTSGWTQRNTGLEREDWACLLAVMAGESAGGPGCTGGFAAVGETAAAEGDPPRLSVAGEAHLESPGASRFTTAVTTTSKTTSSSRSPLRVVYFDSSGAVIAVGGARSQSLPASAEGTHPHHGGRYVVDASVQYPTDHDAVHRIEIQRSDLPQCADEAARAPECVLHTVDASTSPPRDVRVSVRPNGQGWRYRQLRLANADATNTDPAILGGPDRLAAWVSQGEGIPCASGWALVVERLGDRRQAHRCFPARISDPAFGPVQQSAADASGARTVPIAVVVDPGDIQLITFDLDGFAFDDASSIVFSCAPLGQVCREGRPTDPSLQGPASGPDFSPDGSRLVFSAGQVDGGDLGVIDLGDQVPGLEVVPPRRLTLTPRVDERSPSWSHDDSPDAGLELIAFDRCESSGIEPCADEAREIYVLDTRENADTGLPIETFTRVDDGRHPSWGTRFLAFAAAEGPRIVLRHPDGATTDVTGSGTGHSPASEAPSYRDGPVAFVSPPETGDAWIAEPAGNGETEVSIDALDDTPAAEAAAINYAHVWARCPTTGELVTLATALPPTTATAGVDGETRVSFHATIESSARVCGGAEVVAGVSDRESIVRNTEEPAAGTPFRPHRVAINPTEGPFPFYLASQPVVLDGSVEDPESPAESDGNVREGNMLFRWFVDDALVSTASGPTDVPRLRLKLPAGAHQVRLEVVDLTIATEPTTACVAPACQFVTRPIVVVTSGPARFDPATYHVPSSGTLTYHATLPLAQGTTVTSARIVSVNGRALGSWPVPSRAWLGTVKQDGNRVSVKLDRAAAACVPGPGDCRAPNDFLLRNELVPSGGQPASFVMEGTLSNGSTFVVVDHNGPMLIPA